MSTNDKQSDRTKQFTKKQQAAIRRFQKAMEACTNSGVRIFAMDDNIYAISENAVKDHAFTKCLGYGETADAFQSAQYANAENRYHTFNGNFYGCGGW